MITYKYKLYIIKMEEEKQTEEEFDEEDIEYVKDRLKKIGYI